MKPLNSWRVLLGGIACLSLTAAAQESAAPDLTAYIVTPGGPSGTALQRRVGVRRAPGSPILYTVAVSGKRPMTLSAKGLPAGAAFDASNGLIRGTVKTPGTYRVELSAENAAGQAMRVLEFVVGDTFALTPPMGCNTWGGLGPFVGEKGVRESAEAMVKSGLINHGYSYINIDDGWQGVRGGPYNGIQPNEKFGDMKKLCDDLHAMGLKIGNYSTPWKTSYAGFVGGSSDSADGTWEKLPSGRNKGWVVGAHRFEVNDARQAAAWASTTSSTTGASTAWRWLRRWATLCSSSLATSCSNCPIRRPSRMPMPIRRSAR
jgi:alpha-galactosidase